MTRTLITITASALCFEQKNYCWQLTTTHGCVQGGKEEWRSLCSLGGKCSPEPCLTSFTCFGQNCSWQRLQHTALVLLVGTPKTFSWDQDPFHLYIGHHATLHALFYIPSVPAWPNLTGVVTLTYYSYSQVKTKHAECVSWFLRAYILKARIVG